MRFLILRVPPALAFDQRITIALERWTRVKSSTLLYLEAGAFCGEVRLPQVSVGAARIVVAAGQLKLPTIEFFCDVALQSNFPSSSTNSNVQITAAPILGPLIDLSQVECVDEAISSFPKALDLSSQLSTLAPPFLICVIDGFHVFEPSTNNTTHTWDFLGVIKWSLGWKQKVFKVLFTDSKRAFSSVPEIPSETREIVESLKARGSGRAGPPAGRASADLLDTE